MKTTFAVVLSACLLALPAVAQVADPAQVTLDAEVAKLKAARAATYDQLRCDDDELPYDKAAHCFNVVTGGMPNGPIGAGGN